MSLFIDEQRRHCWVQAPLHSWNPKAPGPLLSALCIGTSPKRGNGSAGEQEIGHHMTTMKGRDVRCYTRVLKKHKDPLATCFASLSHPLWACLLTFTILLLQGLLLSHIAPIHENINNWTPQVEYVALHVDMLTLEGPPPPHPHPRRVWFLHLSSGADAQIEAFRERSQCPRLRKFSYKTSARHDSALQSCRVYWSRASDVRDINVTATKKGQTAAVAAVPANVSEANGQSSLIRTPPITSCICKYLRWSTWTRTWSTLRGLRLPSGPECLGRRISALTCLASCYAHLAGDKQPGINGRMNNLGRRQKSYNAGNQINEMNPAIILQG